ARGAARGGAQARPRGEAGGEAADRGGRLRPGVRRAAAQAVDPAAAAESAGARRARGEVRRRRPDTGGPGEGRQFAQLRANADAQLLAIQQAVTALGTDRLDDCTLYVTLEPCAQCAGAIVLAKLGRLVFGAYDDKAGMCGSVGDVVRHSRLNHRVEVLGGVLADECGELLKGFFRARR